MKEYESDIPCALCNEPYGEHRYKDDSCPLFRFSILGHTVSSFFPPVLAGEIKHLAAHAQARHYVL